VNHYYHPRRPRRAWIATALALLIGVLSLIMHAWLSLLVAIFFAVHAAWYFLGEIRLRRFLANLFLIGSAKALHFAAKIATDASPTPPIATLHGHKTGSDPEDPPVTIAQLLDVLDKDSSARTVLEIPNYRITAERITAFEQFVVANVDGEGPKPSAPYPWFAKHNVHE
jgi:hypothetical protein